MRLKNKIALINLAGFSSKGSIGAKAQGLGAKYARQVMSVGSLSHSMLAAFRVEAAPWTHLVHKVFMETRSWRGCTASSTMLWQRFVSSIRLSKRDFMSFRITRNEFTSRTVLYTFSESISNRVREPEELCTSNKMQPSANTSALALKFTWWRWH